MDYTLFVVNGSTGELPELQLGTAPRLALAVRCGRRAVAHHWRGPAITLWTNSSSTEGTTVCPTYSHHS